MALLRDLTSNLFNQARQQANPILQAIGATLNQSSQNRARLGSQFSNDIKNLGVSLQQVPEIKLPQIPKTYQTILRSAPLPTQYKQFTYPLMQKVAGFGAQSLTEDVRGKGRTLERLSQPNYLQRTSQSLRQVPNQTKTQGILSTFTNPAVEDIFNFADLAGGVGMAKRGITKLTSKIPTTFSPGRINFKAFAPEVQDAKTLVKRLMNIGTEDVDVMSDYISMAKRLKSKAPPKELNELGNYLADYLGIKKTSSIKTVAKQFEDILGTIDELTGSGGFARAGKGNVIDAVKVVQPPKGDISLVREAIKSGDLEAAKAIYKNITGKKPSFASLTKTQTVIDNLTPYRGQLSQLEKEIDDIIGFSPTGNWKRDYHNRELLIKATKQSAPPEVVKEIDKLENTMANLKLAKEKIFNLDEAIKTKSQKIVIEKTKQLENALPKKVYLAEPQATKITGKNLAEQKRIAQADFDAWQKSYRQVTKPATPNTLTQIASKQIKTNTLSPGAKDVESLKDLSGFKAYTRDVYRNFKEVYGKRFDDVKRTILDPFDKSKGNFARSLDKWAESLETNIVKGLGIKKGSKESAAVQLFGEGAMTRQELVQKFGVEKAKKIETADKWFRTQYDKLLGEVNAVTKRIYPNDPDKLIPRRKDYYRHFRELQGVKGLLNIFDSPANISSGLAGVSEFTKPKSKWLSFAQQRIGNKTDIDAVGGFIDYIKGAEYRKNIDPHIRNFRGLADELATQTSSTDNDGKLNNFIEFLQDYANDLSGKTNPADRFAQKVVGRKTMAAINWLNSRVKANVILGNASSAIAQIFNVPQGIASAGKYSVKGLGRTISGIFDKSSEMAKSSFISERYAGDVFNKFNTKAIDKAKDFAAWMIGVLDEVGTKYIWNSHYEMALAEGMKDPIKHADDVTRSLVAGRGIGEVPLLQKSKMMQLFAPFQLEVANLWHVLGDQVDQKQFGKIITFMLASYVFNRGAKAIRGSDVSLDPIQASMDAYNAFNEEEDKGIGALKAGGRLAGEALSNLPLGQTVAAAYPEYGATVGDTKLPTRKELFGEGDPTRYGSGILLTKGLQDPLTKIIPPFAGQQIKRTIEGIRAVGKGYSENKTGKIQYPIKQTPANYVKAGIFGKYSVPEARAYFDRSGTVLSEKQTQAVKESGDISGSYNKIINKRDLNRQIEDTKEQMKANDQMVGVVGDKVLIVQDNGDIKTYDKDIKLPTKPKYGSNEQLNKKLESKYNSDLTTASNNVVALFEAGVITEREAEAKLKEIVRHDLDQKLPDPPKYGANATLNKKLKSKYLGQLTTAANNVVKMYEAGLISAEEAEKRLTKIDSLRKKQSSGRKPAKVTIKKPSIKSIKGSTFKPLSIKTPPKPKIVAYKPKSIKIDSESEPVKVKKVSVRIT